MHAPQSKKQGQGNDARHHQRGAPVAQQKEEQQAHHQGPFQQIALHRPQSSAHQFGPIQVRSYANSWGQGGLDGLHALVNGLGHFVAVGSFQHQTDSANHLTMAIFRQRSVPRGKPVPNRGDVAYRQGETGMGWEGHQTDVVQIPVKTFHPDVPSFLAFLNVRAPGIAVPRSNGLKYIRQR